MNEAIYWKAVVESDKRFDGVFFTGVITTGIFCKPSCPARLPKRENVEFFANTSDAEKRGLRACLRCRPFDIGSPDEQTKLAIAVCEYIDKNGAADLKTLGSVLDSSPTHLQKVFKEIIGISPKKYSEFRKLEKFKDGVRNNGDILDAMYAAGFESSSRLYEKSHEKFGMTPSTYKNGGKDMVINYSVSGCSLGKILVAATRKGICAVKIGGDSAELESELKDEFPNAAIKKESELLMHFVDAIVDAVNGNARTPDLPLDLKSTAFQARVWQELRKIPFGETITYAQLAEKIGDKKAVRAVANACAKNRAAIVIPCHRVIGSDGKLTGFRWGVERKKKLLENENPSLKNAPVLFT